MNTVIYYFSATGNSLHTARIIGDKLNAKLIPMPGHMGVTCKSEVIGFVFPTYFWGLPWTVSEFIQKLKVESKNPYIFAVSTYGALHGGVLGHTEQAMNAENLQLSYGKVILAVANFIEEYNPRIGSAKENLKMADLEAAKAAEDILAGVHRSGFRVSVWDRLFYKLYTGTKLNRDGGFHADDKCIGCGICEKVCPYKNIVLKKGRPEFQHRCEHCVACINWCPREAIQWRRVTRKRNRYHHPEVGVKDIIGEMK